MRKLEKLSMKILCLYKSFTNIFKTNDKRPTTQHGLNIGQANFDVTRIKLDELYAPSPLPMLKWLKTV